MSRTRGENAIEFHMYGMREYLIDERGEPPHEFDDEPISTETLCYTLSVLDPTSVWIESSIELNIGECWFEALKEEFEQQYFIGLMNFLIEERMLKTVYPDMGDIFAWSTSVAVDNVRVVIVGDEPYGSQGQANGLAYSVAKGIPIPASLTNIFAELGSDIEGFTTPNHGCLNGWVKQGVLLLNTSLTISPGSESHKDRWDRFIDGLIYYISKNVWSIVFMLWGDDACRKNLSINQSLHLLLCSAAPSSVRFRGCRHFSQANAFLLENKKRAINWNHLP